MNVRHVDWIYYTINIMLYSFPLILVLPNPKFPAISVIYHKTRILCVKMPIHLNQMKNQIQPTADYKFRLKAKTSIYFLEAGLILRHEKYRYSLTHY